RHHRGVRASPARTQGVHPPLRSLQLRRVSLQVFGRLLSRPVFEGGLRGSPKTGSRADSRIGKPATYFPSRVSAVTERRELWLKNGCNVVRAPPSSRARAAGHSRKH